jgi:class 3 adenylate cyclase
MASTVFAIIDLGTPVRVGVHYGQICYDEGRCFGSDININQPSANQFITGECNSRK